MNINIPTGLFILFACTALCGLLWTIFSQRLTRQLEEKFPEVYIAINSPPTALQHRYSVGQMKGIWGLISFVFSRRYLDLPDTEFSRFADKVRLLLFVNIMLLSLSGVGLIEMILNQRSAASTESQLAPPAFVEQGKSLFENQQYAEALVVFNEGILTQQDDANAYYYRALVNYNLNNFSAALDDFQQVVELTPDHFNSYEYIDYLYAREERWEEIIPYWDQYLELKPDDGNAYLERAGTFYRMGSFAEARNGAQRACDLGNAEGCSRMMQIGNSGLL